MKKGKQKAHYCAQADLQNVRDNIIWSLTHWLPSECWSQRLLPAPSSPELLSFFCVPSGGRSKVYCFQVLLRKTKPRGDYPWYEASRRTRICRKHWQSRRLFEGSFWKSKLKFLQFLNMKLSILLSLKLAYTGPQEDLQLYLKNLKACLFQIVFWDFKATKTLEQYMALISFKKFSFLRKEMKWQKEGA